jgi:hypothetical protein
MKCVESLTGSLQSTHKSEQWRRYKVLNTPIFSIVGNPDDGVQVMKATTDGQLVKVNPKKKDRPKK